MLRLRRFQVIGTPDSVPIPTYHGALTIIANGIEIGVKWASSTGPNQTQMPVRRFAAPPLGTP